MSFPAVLQRGDDFLSEYPRTAPWWNAASHFTCLFMTLNSKLLLNLLYKPRVHGIEHMDAAFERARAENRSVVTVMNHMSVVDDPSFVALLPRRYWNDIDNIRWGFAADNVCFGTAAQGWFFNLGKILGIRRFGAGPFQPTVDAAIRIVSPDDSVAPGTVPKTMTADDWQLPVAIQEANLAPQMRPSAESTQLLMPTLPFVRKKTSWFHVFPEGFVLQLQPPDNNSMRYFKWSVSRLILEATRAPIVVPMFAHGFEKVAPEDITGWKRWFPANLGSEINLFIGQQIPDATIERFRVKWRQLVSVLGDPWSTTGDLSQELMTGQWAEKLRSELAAELRTHVAALRRQAGFGPEQAKFASPKWWHAFTTSEGASDQQVKFVGLNWAIRRLQSHLPEYRPGE
ncbi:tafazzin [Diutina catenulata]